MREAKLFILVAALGVIGWLSFAGVAQAHSRPVRFDPAPGTILDTAPEAITGWFSSDIRRAEESFIQVLDADGNNVATGEVQLTQDRRQMSVALQPGIPEGRYVVYWSTFDDEDGEVFGGCFALYVGQAAADDAVANGQPLDGGADCPAPKEEDEDGGSVAPPTGSEPSIALDVSVSGSNADLTITPTNFTPRPPDGSSVDPNFGHYQIYLDKVPVDALTATNDDVGSPEPTDNPVVLAENEHTFEDLAPGVHTVSVALFHDDGTPLSPPVIASQSFTVGGAGGGGDDDGGIPAWTLVLAAVGGLVVGGVGVKLAGGRA